MRILLVNYEFPPIGGGASFSSASLARLLTRRGHDVEILTSRIKGQPDFERLDGLSVHRVRSWRRSVHDCGILGAATFTLFGLVRLTTLLARSRYDVVHCYFALPCGPLGLLASRRGLPYVLSLRGSDVPGYDPTDTLLKALHRCVAPITHWIVSRAALVVANSESLRRLIVKFHRGLHCEVVPNAALNGPAPAVTVAEGGPIRVLCVSRLIARKGIDVLLHSMATLRDVPAVLDIVGNGRQFGRLRALAGRLGLDSSVVFHGDRPHGTVLQLCAAADIFVHPALSESCSMAMIEAMTAGLPIVATRVGGNELLVTEQHNGLLVEARDAQGLAGALRTLIADASLRDRMGRAGAERIRQEFDPMTHAARYEAIYQQAIAAAAAD